MTEPGRSATKRRRGQATRGLWWVAVLAGAAMAQSVQIPAPPQDQPVVIHSATVHPVSRSVIEDGYIIFDHGVISDVGAGVAPDPPGAIRFNAGGMHVYPGLIASDSLLGLQETAAVEVTHDHTEYGDITPEVRAAVAINPDTEMIPVTRANGILTAMVLPRGGLVSGRASLIRLDGWTWEDMAIDAEAGLVLNWPRTEPIAGPKTERSTAEQEQEIEENLRRIDELFDDAQAYITAKDNDPATKTDLRFEAMREALTGEKPIFVRASSAGQIESAVAWAHRRGLRIVIVGGAGSGRVIPLLKEHDVAVMVTGVHRLPTARHEPYDQAFTLPAKLHEGGVRFCIASGSWSAAHERSLNHNAATAAAFGLPRGQALRSVTLDAAEILSVGDRLGSIEVGKAATLIVTNGDPLQISTETLLAFIDGRRIDLGNRQKAMYEKYREKYRQLGLISQ